MMKMCIKPVLTTHTNEISISFCDSLSLLAQSKLPPTWISETFGSGSCTGNSKLSKRGRPYFTSLTDSLELLKSVRFPSDCRNSLRRNSTNFCLWSIFVSYFHLNLFGSNFYCNFDISLLSIRLKNWYQSIVFSLRVFWYCNKLLAVYIYEKNLLLIVNWIQDSF